MAKKKKTEEAPVLTAAEVLAVVSEGNINLSYAKGLTITENYQSVRYDLGIEIRVPTHELTRGAKAIQNYINVELDSLANEKPVAELALAPWEESPIDNLGIEVAATMKTNVTPPAQEKSLAETLDAELDDLTGEAPVVAEGAIPDEF